MLRKNLECRDAIRVVNAVEEASEDDDDGDEASEDAEDEEAYDVGGTSAGGSSSSQGWQQVLDRFDHLELRMNARFDEFQSQLHTITHRQLSQEVRFKRSSRRRVTTFHHPLHRLHHIEGVLLTHLFLCYLIFMSVFVVLSAYLFTLRAM